MIEDMSFGEILENEYVKTTVIQEAENAPMMEKVATHFTLDGCEDGCAQILKFDGFIENPEGDTLIAPTDMVDMWNEETKTAWMNELLARGIDGLREGRRMIVVCLAFGKEKVSDDGIKYLEPWKAHKIDKSEVLEFLGFSNECFWNYVKFLGNDDPKQVIALDPQPLALAFHWETKDNDGKEECPHVHFLFSVKKMS